MFASLTGPQRAAIFYVIAFGLAFVLAFSDVFGELTALATMLTPAIAVVVLMLITGEGLGRSGLASLGLTTLGLKGWWLAILGPAAILVASYAILVSLGMATFQVPAEVAGAGPAIAGNLALGLTLGLIFSFGEEVGWRGYMLSRLMALGVVPAMLIVGFFHGVWHLPLMFLTPYYHADGNLMIVVPLFLVTLTLAGVFFGLLRVWTGSVWPAVIAHAVHNFFWSVGGAFVVAENPETMEYIGGESGILEIAGLILLAVILVPLLRSVTVRRPPNGSAVAA